MRWAFFLLTLASLGGCVVEERPVGDGGVGGNGGDGGTPCESCDGDTPACDLRTGTCVECTPTDDARCMGETPVCDPEGLECVACLDDTGCTDPAAARCNASTLECVPCNDGAQCDDVDGLPGDANACNVDGRCVECTPDTETTTCPGGVSCNPATQRCTGTPVGSRFECQTCVSDSECGDEETEMPSDDYRCVPMFYPVVGNRFPDNATGFCLKVFELGGCDQPYAIRVTDRASLSGGAPDSYCGVNEALATCLAVRALDDNVSCSGDDSDCPTSGLCRDVGGLSDRCTYRCSDLSECKDNPVPGSTCGDGGAGGSDYCGG